MEVSTNEGTGRDGKATTGGSARQARPEHQNVVYELEEGQEVACHHCIEQGCHDTYMKGQAYLAGPGHTPWNGSANNICKDHLDTDAVIHSAEVVRR